MNAVIERIFTAFEQRGSERYGEECVTQMQHALQSGQLAIDSGADDRLVTAAVLHDIGHILGQETLPLGGVSNLDDKHESIGYHFLREHFGVAVADPVRLHVVAKRYLCTQNAAYETRLSPTSQRSFYDQGGPMSFDEIKKFEAEPCFRESLSLRHWDDTAKDPAAVTPPLSEFVRYIEASLA